MISIAYRHNLNTYHSLRIWQHSNLTTRRSIVWNSSSNSKVVSSERTYFPSNDLQGNFAICSFLYVRFDHNFSWAQPQRCIILHFQELFFDLKNDESILVFIPRNSSFAMFAMLSTTKNIWRCFIMIFLVDEQYSGSLKVVYNSFIRHDEFEMRWDEFRDIALIAGRWEYYEQNSVKPRIMMSVQNSVVIAS